MLARSDNGPEGAEYRDDVHEAQVSRKAGCRERLYGVILSGVPLFIYKEPRYSGVRCVLRLNVERAQSILVASLMLGSSVLV